MLNVEKIYIKRNVCCLDYYVLCCIENKSCLKCEEF